MCDRLLDTSPRSSDHMWFDIGGIPTDVSLLPPFAGRIFIHFFIFETIHYSATLRRNCLRAQMQSSVAGTKLAASGAASRRETRASHINRLNGLVGRIARTCNAAPRAIATQAYCAPQSLGDSAPKCDFDVTSRDLM